MVDFSKLKNSIKDHTKEAKKFVKPLEDKIYSIDKDTIKSGYTDIIKTASKIGMSYVPLIGPILAEIIDMVIPNQRTDRIQRYITSLEDRLSSLETNVIIPLLADGNVRKLVIEGCFQAIDNIDDKRRDYITSIVTNGISKDSKNLSKIFKMLDTFKILKDDEISILQMYDGESLDIKDKKAYLSQDNFDPQDYDRINISSGDSSHNIEYLNHLKDLNLLNYNKHNNSDNYLYNSYTITQSGTEMLRYISA